ncbi:sensor histidine kinase [Saccharopolyspora sp. CA-218241]|uniref:sensor histidine kinase n=1 Tax=Saccharopolyspora sp. CA-218241 TaxID=3240027 RepID=UPI003D96C31B
MSTSGRTGRGVAGWSLARQLFVLQVVVVAVVVLAGTGLAWFDAQRRTQQSAQEQVLLVARALAAQPGVRAAISGPDPSATLQPMAERVRRDTGVEFITIMSPDGIRYSHPNPARLGHRFLGHTERAAAGGVIVETYPGTLGPSVRAVVPVRGDTGRVTGLVAVGIGVHVLSAELRGQVTALVLVAVAALALGGVLTRLVGARLRRHTHDLRPAELNRMYGYHEAILHAVREGLLLISPAGRVVLCNDGAAALLPVPDAEGRQVDDLGLPDELAEALRGGGRIRDEVHLTDDRVLVVNVSPVRSGGRDLGTVVTLRDHTDLQALSGELDSLRGFAEALHAQAHESANRLHTVVSLIELGRTEEAVAFATDELELAQRLTDRLVGAVGEPVLAALLLGKTAEAAERGVEVVLTEESWIEEPDIDSAGRIDPRDLVTIVGNLVDNAVEAVLDVPDPRVEVTLRGGPDGLLLRVADNGPGVDAEVVRRIFHRGWSTKRAGRGLGLALVGQRVRRHGGTIEVRADDGAVFEVRLPAAEVAR